MASVKWNGRWMESSSLPIEAKIELGLKEEVKKELSKVSEEQKKSPVKKRKSKKETD